MAILMGQVLVAVKLGGEIIMMRGRLVTMRRDTMLGYLDKWDDEIEIRFLLDDNIHTSGPIDPAEILKERPVLPPPKRSLPY